MATTVKTRGKPGAKPRTVSKAKPKTAPKAKPKALTQPKKKETSQKSIKDTSLRLPDNAVIDLNAYDWGGEKLTDNQKLFVIWYATPGQECYHRVMRAAKKAGYTKNTAHVEAYKLRNDPRIDKLIRQFEENIGKVDIIDTAQRWIHEKITRGDFDIKDYYETVTYEDKLGRPQKKLILKDLEKLTPEQRLCVDGIDVKGQKETMIYVLPDRAKERETFIAMVRKWEMDDSNTDGEEETMEIIMERLTLKKTIRREKDETSRIASLMRVPKGEPVTEL